MLVARLAMPEMHGDDIRPFHVLLPTDADPAERRKMLREKADEIVTAWKSARGRASKLLKTAHKDPGEKKALSLVESMAGDLAKAAVQGGVAATVGGFGAGVVGAAAGFAVGFSANVIPKLVWAKREDDPLRYLSRIEKAGAVVLAVGRPLPPASP
jgi:hypothetical protein